MRAALPLLAVLLGACAQQDVWWGRIDGRPVSPDQVAIDQTICRGEMQKAAVARTAEAAIGSGRALNDVFLGCMASKGYLANP